MLAPGRQRKALGLHRLRTKCGSLLLNLNLPVSDTVVLFVLCSCAEADLATKNTELKDWMISGICCCECMGVWWLSGSCLRGKQNRRWVAAAADDTESLLGSFMERRDVSVIAEFTVVVVVVVHLLCCLAIGGGGLISKAYGNYRISINIFLLMFDWWEEKTEDECQSLLYKLLQSSTLHVCWWCSKENYVLGQGRVLTTSLKRNTILPPCVSPCQQHQQDCAGDSWHWITLIKRQN